MMIRKRLFFVLALFASVLFGCQSDPVGYNKEADAMAALDKAVQEAQNRQCNVLVQVGGEWCGYCVRLNQFLNQDAELLKILKEQYVWLHVYYGKDNKNEEAIARLGDPTGYGFPVIVLLSPDGEVIHTQSTGIFEVNERGYSREKLLAFFKEWANCHEAPVDEATLEDETEELLEESANDQPTE